MKNLILGLALVAGFCACTAPAQKNAVSDGAAGAKPECAGACEAGKSECCAEKSGEAKACAGEQKAACSGMKKVEG